MELAKVSCVHCFISEDPVYGEVFPRREFLVLRQSVEHLSGNSRRMSAQQILRRLLPLEVTPITNTAVSTAFVRCPYTLKLT